MQLNSLKLFLLPTQKSRTVAEALMNKPSHLRVPEEAPSNFGTYITIILNRVNEKMTHKN